MPNVFKTAIGYFVKPYIPNYFNFSGTASRSEFWFYVLGLIVSIFAFSIFVFFALPYIFTFLAVIGVLFSVPANVLAWGTMGLMLLFVILFYIFLFLSLVPLTAISIRRLRDAGYSPWLFLIAFIPILNFALFYFLAQPSKFKLDES